MRVPTSFLPTALLAGLTLAASAAVSVTAAPAAPADTVARAGHTAAVAHVLPASTLADGPAVLEAEVIQRTNAERAAAGLAPLTWNACLQPFSERWADALGAAQTLSHQSMGPLLDGCGFTWAGENVAVGYETPQDVVAGWMDSPGHRANILRPEFTRISVAVAVGGDGRLYWVQNFGTGPDSPYTPPSPAPVSAPAPAPVSGPAPAPTTQRPGIDRGTAVVFEPR